VALQKKSQKTKVDRKLLPQEISLPLGDFIGIEFFLQGSTNDPSRHITCLKGTPQLTKKNFFLKIEVKWRLKPINAHDSYGDQRFYIAHSRATAIIFFSR
jgi:hypothetical protein